jgi:hypothetical protein
VEDWVEVTVQVPRHLVRRFYGLFGELVDETAGATTPVANGATPVVANPGLKPWSEDDDALALKVLHKNDVKAHKFLRLIAERAGEKVPYAEIDAALGWTWNQRAGLQGALGRTITRSGREMPWTTDLYTKTVTMTASIAGLFLRALGERGR